MSDGKDTGTTPTDGGAMDTILAATCDQCGPSVLAMYTVSLPSGGSLAYCGHCTNTHAEKFREIGAFTYQIRY